MTYLTPSEYVQFGLDAATPQAVVKAASAFIDAHCRRPTLATSEYTERVRVSGNIARLSYLPLVAGESAPAIISAKARYGSRSLLPVGCDSEVVTIVAATFGLPGQWISIDPAQLDVNSDSGEVSLPIFALGLVFTEAEIKYRAGLAEIPDPVKIACAQIAKNAMATPSLNVRANSIDRLHMEYFSDALIDSNVRALLRPYVAQRFA